MPLICGKLLTFAHQNTRLYKVACAIGFNSSLFISIIINSYKHIKKNYIMKKNSTEKATARSFRLVCTKDQISTVEALLYAEGFCFESEPFSPWCRIITNEPRPLGSSLAAFFGLIYIQDRSSMLPPLALMQQVNPEQEQCAVLDMCASPGSKTGFLAQLVGKHGFVLGNEPSNSRLATLRANMQQLGFLNVATCSHAGEKLPLIPNTWKYIQLDPPCSGWGTVAKNPQVLDLWKGKKIDPLIDIQRKLLQKAHELLCPGGCVVYSTCTTNMDENEKQVDYAVHELGFELVPLDPFEGFIWEHSSQSGTLRVDGRKSAAQGFYIAKLRKTNNSQAMPNNQLTLPSTEHAISFDKYDPKILAGHCVDLELLPKGHVAVFGATARFIPSVTTSLISSGLRWQAPPLGKILGQGVRLLPHMTALMPQNAPDSAIVLDKIQDIHALLQGQSLKTNLNGRETGLYYSSPKGTLPLGRVSLKNGRVLWTAR